MPTVTKLEVQKKRAGRYSIHIDGRYAFSLSDNDLITSGLHQGQELSNVEVAAMQKLSLESKALDRVYNFLSYRQRTEREVRDYLRRRDYEPEFIDEVIARLQKQGMLSDEQFAASWVGDRQSLKPRSKRRLEQELRQKGVSADIIEQTLAEVSPEDELDAIKTVAQKKLTLAKYQDQSKLITYLVGQGFEYSLVKQALNDLTDELGSGQ